MLPLGTSRLPESEQIAPGLWSWLPTSQGVRFSHPGPRALILQSLSPGYAGTAHLRDQGNLPSPTPPRRDPGRANSALTKMLLDPVEDIHAVLAVHHVHCQTPLAKAACAPNAVQVGLIVWVPILVHREVKIDDHRNLFNVDTCTKGLGEAGRRQRGTISHTYPLGLKTWLGHVTSGMWPLKHTPLKRVCS